jgi:signal peptidase I
VNERAAEAEEPSAASNWAHVFGQLEGGSEPPALVETPVAADTPGSDLLPPDEPWVHAAEVEPHAAAPHSGATPGGGSPPSDDPWAAVAEASGYGGEPSDVAVYRGHERREGGHGTGDGDVAGAAPGERESSGLPAASLPPLWAPEQAEEDDVVLRAFYEHANADEDGPAPDSSEPEPPLEPLLGAHAEELIDEATDSEPRSYPRPEPWVSRRAPADDDQGWIAPADDGPHGWDTGFGGDGPPYDDAYAPDIDPLPEPAPAAATQRTRIVVREVVETVLLAVLVFLCVRASFQNFKVSGESMYPTLDNGQFVIVNKLVYSEVDTEKLSKFLPFIDPGDEPQKHIFHGPERGDIIVLQDPRPDHNEDLIKRVIALPGETIAIRNGQVTIDGYVLKEPYITDPWNDNMPETLLGPHEYFVMGDNRKNSLDSRSGTVGLIHEDLIIGKAMFSYWPTSHFGLAPNASPKLEKPELTTQRLGD